MVRHAFRVLTDDASRRGSSASPTTWMACARCPTTCRTAEMLQALSRQAADRGAGPVHRRVSVLRRRQQCAAARLPRPLRLRIRVRERDRDYRSGRFDATLLKMLAAYDEVKAIILPTLGPERRATYSPFLPISPRTGIVLQVPTVARDAAAGTITYIDPDTGEEVTTPVTGGRVKCQWKADWALRWVALGVDYEMSGKDLIDSVTLASKICRALGGTPPDGFNYELFLDEQRPEDLEVEGERPHHRRVADLRLAGEPVAVHVPEAAGGEAALFRRDPARRRRLLPVPRRLSRARTCRAGSATRSGTSIPAIRRPRRCRCRSRCCSTSRARRTPRTPTSSGASSRAIGPA